MCESAKWQVGEVARYCRWFYETKAAWQRWNGGWVGVGKRWGHPEDCPAKLRARATVGE